MNFMDDLSRKDIAGSLSRFITSSTQLVVALTECVEALTSFLRRK